MTDKASDILMLFEIKVLYDNIITYAQKSVSKKEDCHGIRSEKCHVLFELILKLKRSIERRHKTLTDTLCDCKAMKWCYNINIFLSTKNLFRDLCRGNKTFTTGLFLSPVMMWHTHI